MKGNVKFGKLNLVMPFSLCTWYHRPAGKWKLGLKLKAGNLPSRVWCACG